MDIEFLLILQNFREGAGAFLTAFMEKMTWWGELNIAIALLGVIYWCVSKDFGTYLLMGWSGNRILNGFLKVTACAYRPWIRDARVIPNATAKLTATGYSFPSGHTMNAASIFGGGALRRDLGWGLRAIFWIMLVLVAFSRNFLGVHTPQDVLVGGALGLVVVLLTGKLLKWLEAHPEKDIMVAGIGILVGIAVVVYASVKSYPVDYDAEGKVLVDGAKMALDTFKGVGYSSAFAVGWVLERRFVKFSTDLPMKQRGFRCAAGLFGYFVFTYIICPPVKSALAGAAGNFVSCFIQMFYVVYIFPAFMAWTERKPVQAA